MNWNKCFGLKFFPSSLGVVGQCDQKKIANVYKSCPKMILTPLQKLPKNVRDSGKLIAAKGFKKLPKVQ